MLAVSIPSKLPRKRVVPAKRGTLCLQTSRVSSCDSVLDVDAKGYIQRSLSKAKCQRKAFRPIHWLSAVGIVGAGSCHGQVDLEEGRLRLVDTEVLPRDTYIAPVMPAPVQRMRCDVCCERALMSKACGPETCGSLASLQPLAVSLWLCSRGAVVNVRGP